MAACDTLISRQIIGLFQLSQDLGLADYHRVETRGHTKEMPDGLRLLKYVHIGAYGFRLEPVGGSEKARERCFRIEVVLQCGRNLDAIAGRKDQALLEPWFVLQKLQSLCQSLRRESEPLADLDRSGSMIDAG